MGHQNFPAPVAHANFSMLACAVVGTFQTFWPPGGGGGGVRDYTWAPPMTERVWTLAVLGKGEEIWIGGKKNTSRGLMRLLDARFVAKHADAQQNMIWFSTTQKVATKQSTERIGHG